MDENMKLDVRQVCLCEQARGETAMQHFWQSLESGFKDLKPQAEASPIDKEGTLRNTDWLEADRTRKAEARFRHGNKRLTPPIMTRFDDVNKKVQKGATLSTALQFGKVV
ncbi:Anaerobic glycerol-3-phosphate dehydrogenase subunit [Trichinella pseudospiralis]